MTGYGRYDLTASWGLISCEIRSVNHRYLELNFKWSEIYRPLEEQARKVFTSKLNRGKIDISLNVVMNKDHPSTLSLNEPLWDALHSVYHQILKSTDLDIKLNMGDVLNWPNMIMKNAPKIEFLQSEIMISINQAVLNLLEMRKNEGCALTSILKLKNEELRQFTQNVEQLIPNQQTAIRKKLEMKLGEINQTLNSERIEQELLLYLNKLDISEELERLNAHIHAFEALLNENQPVGRKMDFLAQEMNREANTIASKSGSIALSQLAVNMKVIIEQMREQVQNIE